MCSLTEKIGFISIWLFIGSLIVNFCWVKNHIGVYKRADLIKGLMSGVLLGPLAYFLSKSKVNDSIRYLVLNDLNTKMVRRALEVSKIYFNGVFMNKITAGPREKVSDYRLLLLKEVTTYSQDESVLAASVLFHVKHEKSLPDEFIATMFGPKTLKIVKEVTFFYSEVYDDSFFDGVKITKFDEISYEAQIIILCDINLSALSSSVRGTARSLEELKRLRQDLCYFSGQKKSQLWLEVVSKINREIVNRIKKEPMRAA